MLARQPISARRVASVLRVHYANAKRTARELVRWDILRPSPEGLRFQPEAQRWELPERVFEPPPSASPTTEQAGGGPPAAPAVTASRRSKPSKAGKPRKLAKPTKQQPADSAAEATEVAI